MDPRPSDIQLFISHASEDKADFVRPLAEALKLHFRVWYDEYELTLGDSLRRKIDAGLATCDYGVVVLSPHFFAKKWPQDELDGLYAQEHPNRKVILPIWKDIDEAGVRAFSPMLAGRMAVSASEGIDRVVASIKRGVGVAERARELAQSGALDLRIKRLDLSLRTRSLAEAKLRTVEGVREIEAEAKRLCDLLREQIEKAANAATHLKFAFRVGLGGFEVRAPFNLRLNVRLSEHAINAANEAMLECAFFQLPPAIDFTRQRVHPTDLHTNSFRPYFGAEGQPVWTKPHSTAESYTSEQLVVLLGEKLIDYIERESRG